MVYHERSTEGAESNGGDGGKGIKGDRSNFGCLIIGYSKTKHETCPIFDSQSTELKIFAIHMLLYAPQSNKMNQVARSMGGH
jgi:hypothetical protein